MRYVLGGVLAAVLLAGLAAGSSAQTDAPTVPGNHDCSRWPASVYEGTSGTCMCPPGMWWNLRGDACLPKEHAAGEFCGTVWPSSQPLFTSGGGYRCVCIPPLLWDSQATGCRSPMVSGEEDCLREWPGTLPVLSPSGTEFECRCPGGRRWDDGRRTCVDGAPVVSVSRGFFVPDGTAPPTGPAAMPPAAGTAVMPPAAGTAAVPGNAALPPAAAVPPNGSQPSYAPPPEPGIGEENERVQPESGRYPPGAGHVAPAPVPGAATPPSPGFAAPSTGSSATCDALLAEIRARAAAGQTSQADSLGMKAAIAGCDPKAISDASRTKPPAR